MMNNLNGCFTIMDWNMVKGAIRLQVTSNEKDTKGVLYKQYADLYVIPCFQIISDKARKMVKITNKICQYFDITKESVFKTAFENMLSEARLLSNADIIGEILFMNSYTMNYMKDKLPDKFTFLTLTNEYHNNAAAAVFCPEVQMRLSELFPEGYYLLPSSIHEFLIYPYDGCTVENLLEVVKDVNRTLVSKINFLSDNVYYFDKNDNFCIAYSDIKSVC